jgi:tRNA pseudouridine32 synthase/23S rRNA pseudouridine746 synthase
VSECTPELELPPYVVPHSQEPIPILYRDQDLLIVDKPHLLLSVPGRHPLNRDSLMGRLGERYPGVAAVHRLDLDTSGLLVVPRHRDALATLSRAFQRREVAKTYQAIVWGSVTEDSGEIDLPIARDWENRPRQKICHDSGKPSLTRWRVLSRSDNRSLVELSPITGRSHQLRIHMRELGHPILGCDMYAHPEALTAAPRLMLHAQRLAFHHPRTGAWISAHSPSRFRLP